jgi:hypothetical protein
MNLNTYYPAGPFGLHAGGDIGAALQPHHHAHHMHHLQINGFHHQGLGRSGSDDGFQLHSPGGGYGSGVGRASSSSAVGGGYDLTTSGMNGQPQRRPSSLHSDTVDGSVVDGLEMSSPPPPPLQRESVSERYRGGSADSIVGGYGGIGLQQQQQHLMGNGVMSHQRPHGLGIDHRAVAAAAAAAAHHHHQQMQHHQQQQHCWSMSSGGLSGDDSRSPTPFGTSATGGPATPVIGRGCCGGAGPDDCSPTGGLMCVTDQQSPTAGASSLGGGSAFGGCSASSGLSPSGMPPHVPFYPWMGVVGECVRCFLCRSDTNSLPTHAAAVVGLKWLRKLKIAVY